MTIDMALRQKDIDPTDAELLLAHALNVHRTALFLEPKKELTEAQKSLFGNFISRRKTGEPVAYILQEKEFYARPFFVDPSVLIPRPATEGLIEVVLETLLNKQSIEREIDEDIIALSFFWKNPEIIIDIGTGSGCIAVTLAMEQSLPVIATDISSDALEVAKKNSARFQTNVKFVHGNMLEPIHDLTIPFFVVSNPPYIPEGTQLMNDVAAFEPHEALFAGRDGLGVIKPLLAACNANRYCAGIALECRADQKAEVISCLAQEAAKIRT